jgi:uncharacterized protein with PIN domain
MGSLIDRVIVEIQRDFAMGDLTALDELLSFIPRENLLGYLPEEEWEKYENEYCCDNCGGGFIREEMAFDINDQDLCKDCNSSIQHQNYMKEI